MEKVIFELIGMVKRFIWRDLIYFLGGLCVAFSFMVMVESENPNMIFDDITKAGFMAQLLFIGLCYVLGYCVQDTCSWIGLVTTAYNTQPSRFTRWLYKRFERRDWGLPQERSAQETDTDWKNRIRAELDKADSFICKWEDSDPRRHEHERIIGFMQIGTTIGPCLIVSAILLTIGGGGWDALRFTFPVSVVGVLLVLLSRIKVLQYTRFVAKATE